jgi:hypothetical protein
MYGLKCPRVLLHLQTSGKRSMSRLKDGEEGNRAVKARPTSSVDYDTSAIQL